MPRNMAKSFWLANLTLQELTTAVIMGMSWMEHTQENASMMVLGMERLQNAVGQGEVRDNARFQFYPQQDF